MKVDIKTGIIFLLSGVIFVLIGYLIGSRSGNHSSEIPADPKVQKEYKDQVARSIRSRSSEIKACYIDYLANKPKITEGKVDLVFDVEKNGVINGMESGLNELQDKHIEKCISQALSGLRFPPLPLGMNSFISHTIAFKSEETIKKENEMRKNLLPKVLPVE